MGTSEPGRAREFFMSGYFCSEAIPKAFAETYKYPESTLIRGASLLGGGLCNFGGPCGTLLGGLLTIGAVVSSDQVQDKSQRRAARTLGTQLIAWFSNQYGGISCRELIGYDLLDAEQATAYKQSSGLCFCADMVEATAQWIKDNLPSTGAGP